MVRAATQRPETETLRNGACSAPRDSRAVAVGHVPLCLLNYKHLSSVVRSDIKLRESRLLNENRYELI